MPRGYYPTAILLSGVALFSSASATCQTFHFVPTLTIEETLTDNVRLEPSGIAKSDLVTQLTPAFSVSAASARTILGGTVAVPILLYARTGADNDKVLPQVNLTGTVEAVEKFFYVDGVVAVNQQYLTPFGPRPLTFANATQNRFTSESYSASPYVRGVTQGGIKYELRDTNIWTNINDAPASLNGAYSNVVSGSFVKDPTPVGWSADYLRNEARFSDQAPLITQFGRVRLVIQVDPQLQLSSGGGYEDNHYPLANIHGATYNLGGRWRPTERTDVSASWEHRFFGSSYRFAFEHRTPLSVWNVSASRDINDYPQQLATAPVGTSIVALLNELFLSSFPDPVQRQAFIDQLIRNQGLPLFLTSPFSLYTEQILLQENETATFGLLGASNSIFFTAFRVRSEPISGAGTALPGLLFALGNNTQKGGSLVWTHRLNSSMSLDAGADLLRTTANASPGGKTTQGGVHATLTSPVSPNTSIYAGARFQVLRSDIVDAYREAAVFAGLTYTFR